jgi:hypothetical protein
MPEDLKQVGRLRLLKAIAHINLKQFKKAAEIVNDKFFMRDIREGELSISEIWLKLYTTIAAEEAGITDRDEAEKLARERYPLPKHLDFRMTV